MRKSLLLIVLLILVAIFTNPGLEKHQEAVKNQMQDLEHLDPDIDTDEIKKIGALLGDIIGLNSIEKYLDNNVKTDDLKVCSFTQLKIKGEFKTVGIGIFGKVFLFGDLKDIIKEKAEELKEK